MVDRNIVVLLVLLYAIPSLLLYVTVLFVLLRKKEFSGSFYRLFFLNGLLDIYQWLNFYLTWRVGNASIFYPFFEFIPSEGIIPTFIVWSYYYSFYAQLTTFFFLTFNRFTAFFITYAKIWKYLLPIAFITIFLIGWPVTWMYIVVGGYVYNSTDGYMVVSDMRFVLGIDDSIIQTIFVLTVGGLCVLTNISTGVRILMSQKNLRDATKDNKSDIKLFVMSLIMLVSYSLTCWVLYQFTCCFNDHSNDIGWYFAIVELWYYAADLSFLLPPWLLLLTSTTVRKEFKKTVLCFFKPKNSKSLFIVTANSNLKSK